MLHAYWGFARPPFCIDGSTPLFHEAETQVEAIARLRFVVENRFRTALVVGARGCGKTTLLDRFARECCELGRQTVQINLAGTTPREALWLAASQMAINPRGDDDAAQLVGRFSNRAASAVLRNDHAVLLVDDADLGGPDVLTQMRRLTKLGDRATGWLTLILAANPSSVDRLGEAMLDGTGMRVDLDPWQEGDTIEFVQLALFEAGCDRPLFDDHALSVLHTLSAGVPRDVNRLANYALLGAAAEGRTAVDAGVVEAAYDALKSTVPA